MDKIKIVAEIGCNHNGDIELAKKLVKAARISGADAVKFQLFNAEKLVSRLASKAEYQKKDNESDSQLEMLKDLEMSQKAYLQIKSYAESLKIDVFATPFDLESIDYLASIGQHIWKIPSGEITNLPYLEAVRDINCLNKEIVLSTGMSTLEEISAAVNVLEKSNDTKFTILHCNTDYPTTDVDMNLRAIIDLKKNYPNWNVGLSDHSEGIVAAIAAVGMGITFIEKHFTVDKSLPGPDHQASITPRELNELCTNLRRVESMLGQERKIVTESEKKNKYVARKSIVASRDITKGEIFTSENITCKRPGNGISPMNWYRILGKIAESDFGCDDLITCSYIEWEDAHE